MPAIVSIENWKGHADHPSYRNQDLIDRRQVAFTTKDIIVRRWFQCLSIMAMLLTACDSSSLDTAVNQGNLEEVKRLLDGGADINWKPTGGFTVLHAAVDRRKVDIAEYLIQRGADVNAHSRFYLITLSARKSTSGGIVMPSALDVFRLITSWNFVGCSIGSSPGFAPFRILSTKIAVRRYSFV